MTSPAPHASRRAAWLLAASALLLAGCVDDMPTVLRDRLAQKSEQLDAIMHVVDSDTAKYYVKFLQKRHTDRLMDLDDRQRKIEDNMEKKDQKAWKEAEKKMKEYIASKKFPQADEFEGPSQKIYLNYTRECVAWELAADREKLRLGVLMMQPGQDAASLREVGSSLSKK